ncbi:HupE/UreJ family protein [Flavobacteriaceae bacterium GF1]
MKKYVPQLLFVLFLLIPIAVSSHEPNQSFIYVRVYEQTGIDGRFELNVNQLNSVLNLNLDKHPSPEDIRPFEKQIQEYILRNTAFSSIHGAHAILFTGEITMLKIGYGSYVQLYFHLENSEVLPEEIEVTHGVFIEENRGHRNFLTMEYNWKAGLINNEAVFALDFTEGNTTKTWDLSDRSTWNGFMAMIKQGVWHIWIGLDHILFLVALILPSVVRRKQREKQHPESQSKAKFDIWGWVPVDNFKSAFWYIIKIVTFFTIAHTITLSLASLQIIVLPSRIVETVIAFSIGLAAFHNIRPIFKGRDWVIAFIFGLFHGFGFASVLGDLGFNGEHLVLSLLGFNIGVEIGQVVIIAAIFPFLFLIRKRKLYPKFLVFMSVLLILMSLNWILERGFEIDFGVDHFIRKVRFELARWFGIR